MEQKTKDTLAEPLSPLVDLSETKPPCVGEVPDVVIVFELDHQQYASGRAHFDHLIDNHNLSAHVHFEDQI
jgi:hypothetical protein